MPTALASLRPAAAQTMELRVRGRVQGVGFRPTVWRLAQRLGLDGDVRNDADGVLIRLAGTETSLSAFRRLLECEPPPLARIAAIEVSGFSGRLASGFRIIESTGGAAHTEVSPDARICPACAMEIADPANRRFGYGLTNCTDCGPRLSIVRGIPYDRARTTMSPFAMCDDCRAEYENPADRRFHAEPICCPACGPAVHCLPLGNDDQAGGIAFAAECLRRGEILAIKGIGGYQLACDATNAEAVAWLRTAKRREGKPFALMARDLDTIRRYCAVSPEEALQLAAPAAPIVLLRARRPLSLPPAVAPGMARLGFMLPTSPLHTLLIQNLDWPLVMTSGNISDAPQITDDTEGRQVFAGIAAHILNHDRAIASRLDDSVLRFMAGKPRLLRRARGYAPAPIALPEGFENAPEILAMGGEAKATFCLIKDGQAILSQHQGDLEHPDAFNDYRKNLGLYSAMFDHTPCAVAADLHPEYLSAKLARSMAGPLIEVQHHHAHIAACLCENGHPLDAPPVLGIALDGLGWGDDGTLWGAEFLRTDYFGYHRLAALKPIAIPGGAMAAREPWRNLYAHIAASLGWPEFADEFANLPACVYLKTKPLATLQAMIARGINTHSASSCGRLFDAVAAALGLRADRQSYEGEAAAHLEALAENAWNDVDAYPFALSAAQGFHILDPAPMWRALFADLARGVPVAPIAASFHLGFAAGIAATANTLATEHGLQIIALSGGCFQNALLFEETSRRLGAAGFKVLSHTQIPANDGGLALGQAAIAAALLLRPEQRIASCA